MRDAEGRDVTIHGMEEVGEPVDAYLPRLVPWLHEASNPFADWYFGSSEVARDILGEWARRPSSELYVGRATLAWDGLRRAGPVACVLGMDGVTLRRCRSADLQAFCDELGDGPEAAAVLAEVLPVARALFPPVDADAFYISRVAVAATVRGRGVGRRLVSSVMATQRARGFERFCLDVSVDNAPAVRTYSAIGFWVEGTARDAHSGLAYHRMCAA